jgi:hypothetical protein
MYKWLFASRISLRGSLLRSDSQAQFHTGANFIEKQKLLRKLYEPTLKIYTDEIAMCAKVHTNRKMNKWLFHEYVPKFNREKTIYTNETTKKYHERDGFAGSRQSLVTTTGFRGRCLLAGAFCQSNGSGEPEPVNTSFYLKSLTVNGVFSGYDYKGINTAPVIRVTFSSPFRQSSVEGAVVFENNYSAPVSVRLTYENNDSTLVIKPASALSYLSKYTVTVNTSLKSKAGVDLPSPVTINLMTAIDSTNKYPVIPDDELFDPGTKTNIQLFLGLWASGFRYGPRAKYIRRYCDFRGTGFGIMAIPVAIERKFITRSDGLARMQKIVGFLKNKANRFMELIRTG